MLNAVAGKVIQASMLNAVAGKVIQASMLNAVADILTLCTHQNAGVLTLLWLYNYSVDQSKAQKVARMNKCLNNIFAIRSFFCPTFSKKHCQRHNGPEGWVLITKVSYLGHITSSQKILIRFHLHNLGQAAASKPEPNFSIWTKLKLQNLNQT